MEWAFCVTKVWGKLVISLVCLVFVTWNGCLVLQRCLNTGVLVGLSGVCDMEWVLGVTKVLEDWCLSRFAWCL